jgi:hypothetical protein
MIHEFGHATAHNLLDDPNQSFTQSIVSRTLCGVPKVLPSGNSTKATQAI